MPSVKFFIQSKSDSAPIYVYLSLGRGKLIHRKTGRYINPKDWSDSTKLPKQNNPANKNLASELRKLKGFILDELNKVNKDQVTGNWLISKIDLFFGRVEPVELDYLTEYGEHFIKHLKYKKNRNGGTGVSASTKKKYRTIVNKLIEYESYRGQRIKIIDVNTEFRTQIMDYFDEVDKLGDNTIGRYLKFIKTICTDAQKNGHKVSKQLEHFNGFTVKAPKTILSLDELDKIQNTKLVNEALEVARDWLIIGCYTGQRVSDLLRMNKSFIEHIQDYDFIVLEQEKTKKTVQIPIHYEVKKVLDKRNGEFPPTFAKTIDSSKTMFNRYLKQLCKVAEINTVVSGNKFDKETKRNIKGDFEKHELVSSHICRRSFASNFYGNPLYPTPILMNITGHSTEKMFLEYIGKKPLDYSLQLAKIWQEIGLKKKQKDKMDSGLKLIKKASNE